MSETEWLKAFGKRVQKARKSARLSQEGLAEAVGLSAAMVGKLERGLSFTNLGTLVRISQAVNEPLAQLFDWAPRVARTAEERAFDNAVAKIRLQLNAGEDVNLEDIAELLLAISHRHPHTPKRKAR